MAIRLTCGYGKEDSGCGKTWTYNGDKAVTSCPNCGNRVRTGLQIQRQRGGTAPQNVSSQPAGQPRYY